MSTTEKMIDHISTLGPNRVIPKNFCETKIKTHKVSYVWIIHNFSIHQQKLSQNEILKSPLFQSITESKNKWFLGVRPSTIFSYREYTELYLNLHDTSESEKTFGKYKIYFLDENKKELKVHPYEDLKSFCTENSGCITVFKNDEILSSTDKLSIYCEITFSEVDPLTDTFVQLNSIKHNPAVPELRLVEDIGKLFGNEKFTDFVISVKGKNYKVHKTILIARSPVFAAMLKHENLKESQQNKEDISDFDEKVVEEMLRYIYTGKLENLETLAADLLAAAEKYGLDGLKTICESTLAKRLSAENAIEMLILADLHDARRLKSNILNFIVEKYSEVMKSAIWKNIAPLYPQLLIEVFEALSGQMDCKLVIKNL